MVFCKARCIRINKKLVSKQTKYLKMEKITFFNGPLCRPVFKPMQYPLKIVIFFHFHEVFPFGDLINLKARAKKWFPSSMQGGCSCVRFKPPTKTAFFTVLYMQSSHQKRIFIEALIKIWNYFQNVLVLDASNCNSEI